MQKENRVISTLSVLYGKKWRMLRSAISVAFEILVEKLQFGETEAYHEKMTINYKTF